MRVLRLAASRLKNELLAHMPVSRGVGRACAGAAAREER
jgi:hypothetical protein